MAVERRLRLHAVRVGGHDRPLFAVGEFPERAAHFRERRENLHEALEIEPRVGGRENVLARAADVQDARRHACAAKQFRLERDVEFRALCARLFAFAAHVVQGAGELSGVFAVEQSRLHVRDDRGAVDELQPVFRVEGCALAAFRDGIFRRARRGYAPHVHSQHLFFSPRGAECECVLKRVPP